MAGGGPQDDPQYGPATYGDRFAPVYDARYAAPAAARTEATVAFLAALAGPGPALELGIGTGRVALPLQARGVAVHGIDASAAMVATLRAKPGGAALPVSVGDMADVPVEPGAGPFALVYVVANTFFGLLTQEDQVRCFQNVARHLAPQGAFVLDAFVPDPARFEADKGLVRGQPGSELSAMVFGEYFPNPALFGTDAAARALVSPLMATLVEGFGTAVLVFLIFALTDPNNAGAPPPPLAPFFIGFTVAVLISLFAPITQAGWNPARDLGPRLVALALGWGSVAVPGPRWGFLAYIVGPLVGGPLGAALYDRLIRPGLQSAPYIGEERS